MSEHQAITLLGFAAAACTTLAFLPQVIRTVITKNTSSISLSTYVLLTLGTLLWLLFGIFLNESPIIVANAITMILAAVILVYKLRFK